MPVSTASLMICMIDAHTHVFPIWLEHMAKVGIGLKHFRKLKTGASIENLEAQALFAGIDKCFVFPLPVSVFLDASNKYIESIKNERFVKFGCISKKEDVGKLKEKGFSGIKIHRHFQRNPVSHIKEILDACEQKEMIVSLHLSEHLFEFDSVSKELIPILQNRTNPIIVAHLSAIEHLIDSEVFFDTALRTEKDIKNVMDIIGSKRILFGSDFPVVTIDKELTKFDGFKENERKRILHNNAAKIIKWI